MNRTSVLPRASHIFEFQFIFCTPADFCRVRSARTGSGFPPLSFAVHSRTGTYKFSFHANSAWRCVRVASTAQKHTTHNADARRRQHGAKFTNINSGRSLTNFHDLAWRAGGVVASPSRSVIARNFREWRTERRRTHRKSHTAHSLLCKHTGKNHRRMVPRESCA